MSHYLDYLEESTSIVKSHNKMIALILIITYLTIWAASLITFWFWIDAGDAMAYSILFLWILLPATTLIISLLIGKNNCFGGWKWLSPAGFGIMYMLAEYATFSAANMSAFHKINLPDLEMLITGAVISLLGLGIGAAVNYFQNRLRKKPT